MALSQKQTGVSPTLNRLITVASDRIFRSWLAQPHSGAFHIILCFRSAVQTVQRGRECCTVPSNGKQTQVFTRPDYLKKVSGLMRIGAKPPAPGKIFNNTEDRPLRCYPEDGSELTCLKRGAYCLLSSAERRGTGLHLMGELECSLRGCTDFKRTRLLSLATLWLMYGEVLWLFELTHSNSHTL